MRKEFDIKYRQEIESGKYRVETITGLPVRIICWDAKSDGRDDDIIALVESNSGAEKIQRYYSNGQLISDSARVGNKDLCIIENIEEVYQCLIKYIKAYDIYWGGNSKDDIIACLDKLHSNYVAKPDFKNKVFDIMKKLHKLNFSVPLGSDIEALINEITSDVRDLLD